MKWIHTFLVLSFVLSAPDAFAQPGGKAANPTAEQRKEMAKAHEEMATCLRSDKNMEECRNTMWESMHAQMGDEACPMMGYGKGKQRAMKGMQKGAGSQN